jgi:hypothetical protein
MIYVSLDPITGISTIVSAPDGYYWANSGYTVYFHVLNGQVDSIDDCSDSYGGVLVVDLYNNSALNVIGLVANTEVANNHLGAHTGNNIIPSFQPPEDALMLTSDLITNAVLDLNWRFEFNIAQLIVTYPYSTQFVFDIKGRSNLAGAISGAFGVKTFSSKMILSGSPGSYEPGIIGSNLDDVVFFDSSVVAGANGSYAESDLTTIIEFTYDVVNKELTYTNA